MYKIQWYGDLIIDVDHSDQKLDKQNELVAAHCMGELGGSSHEHNFTRWPCLVDVFMENSIFQLLLLLLY